MEIQFGASGWRAVIADEFKGVKFIFADGSWLLMGPSGTEPRVRTYAESESAKGLGGAS